MMPFRSLSFFKSYIPEGKKDQRERLAVLRSELRKTHAEIREIGPRHEVLKRHKAELLRLICELENWQW